MQCAMKSRRRSLNRSIDIHKHYLTNMGVVFKIGEGYASVKWGNICMRSVRQILYS